VRPAGAASLLALALGCGGPSGAEILPGPGPESDEADPTRDPGGTAGTLPACVSDLGRRIAAAIEPVAGAGTIPLRQALSTQTRLDPEVWIAGPRIFGRMAELVASARREVSMQFYKWEPGTDPTETILGGIRAIEERRIAEGDDGPPVMVRMVIDTSALGVAAPVTSEHMPLVRAQIDSFGLDPAHVQVVLAANERTLLDQFGNIHVKTVTIDGRVVMITGANPEAQHDFVTPWHDAGFVLWGREPAAAALTDFDFSWADATVWTCGPTDTDPARCARPTEPIVHEVLAEDTPTETLDACLALCVTRQPSAFANNSVDNPQDQTFLAAFDGATHTIRIETPNLNDDAAKEAILRAVLRGVRVQVITSHGFNDASEAAVGGTNVDNVAALWRDLRLLGAADPCAGLQVRWYSHDGATPVEGNGPWASHVKYASVDGQVVIFGTTNMDTASWNFSHELDWAIDDASVTAATDEQVWEPDWSRAIPAGGC